MTFFKLVWRNLTRHFVRSGLTVGSLVVALFLMCTLRSLVTTISAGLDVASARRLVVQSAVSLFVDLPPAYQAKIAGVSGVERTCKAQWFGGYYQDPSGRFAQFAVDPADILAIYPEIELVEGSAEAFERDRRGAIIGEGLVRRFGWKLGDTVPLIGELFVHPDGPGTAWEFVVEAIYRPTRKNIDDTVLYFHYDYFRETLEAGGQDPGVGTYVLQLEHGADPTAVMAAVDELFENGPQRVQTTTESEFQKQFISMMGNIPFFLGSIGGGVFFAILLACINTMLMAGREQTHDVGILKALGFPDRTAFALLALQSLLLCGVGGGLGVLLAVATAPGIAAGLGSFFPGYAVQPSTVLVGVGVTLAVGVFSAAVPALRASRLRCVEALGNTE